MQTWTRLLENGRHGHGNKSVEMEEFTSAKYSVDTHAGGEPGNTTNAGGEPDNTTNAGGEPDNITNAGGEPGNTNADGETDNINAGGESGKFDH